ncbi:MAG TPA: cupredoxin domain-containing protein [Thermoleophilaceae bacterium]|nr:cupredoxin domain-containing protein [Thermoleophilaceae bacterium]
MRWVALTGLIFLAGCGGGDMAGDGGAQKVAIEDFKYGPDTIDVKAGDTVDFTNEDGAKHTATSKPQGTFDSGDIAQGQTRPVTFRKAGSFRLYCVYHPTMAARVTVTK